MRVWYLTNIAAPYRVNFFNELGKQCELTVVFERIDALDREKEWISNKFLNFRGVFLHGKSIGTEQALCFDVLKILKQEKFDIYIIGGYSTPTGMLCIRFFKRNKFKFIINYDGGFIKRENIIKRKLKKYLISSASAWLSSGKESNKSLIYYGARSADIFEYPFTSIYEKDIINHPLTKREKKVIRNKLNISEENIVLSVGQIIYRKGFDLLIRAAALGNSNIGYYIIGGRPTEELENLINELRLNNIHFIPFMKKDELYEYYKAADVFVMPTREDIWGLVINEAMANGLPIISSDRCIAGMELVHPLENGYVVASERPEQYAKAIKSVIDSDLIKMGMASLNYITDYTIENMVNVHLRIMESFYENHHKGK